MFYARRRPVLMLARITASAAITGANYRWNYTLQPLHLADGFTVATEDLATTAGGTLAGVNVREFENTATSVQGQNPSSLPSGFDYSPCAGIVQVFSGSSFPLAIGGSVVPALFFSLDNPVTGTCS